MVRPCGRTQIQTRIRIRISNQNTGSVRSNTITSSWRPCGEPSSWNPFSSRHVSLSSWPCETPRFLSEQEEDEHDEQRHIRSSVVKRTVPLSGANSQGLDRTFAPPPSVGVNRRREPHHTRVSDPMATPRAARPLESSTQHAGRQRHSTSTSRGGRAEHGHEPRNVVARFRLNTAVYCADAVRELAFGCVSFFRYRLPPRFIASAAGTAG